MGDFVDFQRHERAKRDAEALAAAGPVPVPPLHSWSSGGNASTQVQLEAGRFELRFVPAIERGSVWHNDPGYSQKFWSEREPPPPTGKVDLTKLGTAIAEHFKLRDADQMTEALGLEGRLALAEKLGLVAEGGPTITDPTGTVIRAGAGEFELTAPTIVTVEFGALPGVVGIWNKE